MSFLGAIKRLKHTSADIAVPVSVSRIAILIVVTWSGTAILGVCPPLYAWGTVVPCVLLASVLAQKQRYAVAAIVSIVGIVGAIPYLGTFADIRPAKQHEMLANDGVVEWFRESRDARPVFVMEGSLRGRGELVLRLYECGNGQCTLLMSKGCSIGQSTVPRDYWRRFKILVALREVKHSIGRCLEIETFGDHGGGASVQDNISSLVEPESVRICAMRLRSGESGVAYIEGRDVDEVPTHCDLEWYMERNRGRFYAIVVSVR